ncbi:hypothetical protein [Bradyrhizobium sp. USDA 4502]
MSDRAIAADMTAVRFMQVAELAGKSNKLLDLEIPVSGLYLLAAPSTPEEAQQEIIARAESGETLSVAYVGIINEASAGNTPLGKTRRNYGPFFAGDVAVEHALALVEQMDAHQPRKILLINHALGARPPRIFRAIQISCRFRSRCLHVASAFVLTHSDVL